MNKAVNTVVLASVLALAGTNCTASSSPELTAEQAVALQAAIDDAIDPSLPATAPELHDAGARILDRTRPQVSCPIRGVMAGVWRRGEQPSFAGTWARLGSGERGGTLEGEHGEHAFQGTFAADDVAGHLIGSYDRGRFEGSWQVSAVDGRAGQLAGRYHRRGQQRGYFFGWWAGCDTTPGR